MTTEQPASIDSHAYTYLCRDGFARTRCRAHIPRTGPYSPHPTAHAVFIALSHCVECDPASALQEMKEE